MEGGEKEGQTSCAAKLVRGRGEKLRLWIKAVKGGTERVGKNLPSAAGRGSERSAQEVKVQERKGGNSN